MNERYDIQFGEAFVQNLQDDSGYVDLTGATVVLQYRVECGTITDHAATVTDEDTGGVSASSIPVGAYNIRWKVTIGAVTTYYPGYGWDQLTVRAVDACTTFDIFVSNIAQTIFPEGESENLLRNHRQYIADALIDLQQKVPCLRTKHRDRHSMADTFLDCAASVLDAPRGFIGQIYAVTQDNCCAKRYFTPIDHDEMLQILADNQNCGTLVDPTYYYYIDGYGYLDYPAYGCLYYGDSSGATDLSVRPTTGGSFVSMHNGLLYLFPWLQANEVLVVEWDGIKRSWKDTDEVTWDREVQDAVEHFLASKTGYREDCDLQKVQVERGMYDELVRKQIWQCRKERRIERRQHYFTNCGDYCNAGTRQTAGTGGGSISQLNDCQVDNYTELRALNPSPCQSVKVLGYATAFDGGGGIFIRKANIPAQTDNDGTIVVSTNNGAYYWQKWL